jgi:hypothetical protein
VVGVPWRRFAREPLVLFLVLLTTFSVVNPANVQDVSRLALGVSVLSRGTLKIDRYVSQTGEDNASWGAHSYTDKAPGLSFFALPQTAIALAVDSLTGHHGERVWNRMWELWPLRLLVNGLLLVLLCLTLGRVAEGLVPRAGSVVAVTAGLGTMLGPLATVLFEHDGVALLAFGSFCLAWAHRPTLAGLAAGCAVLFAYDAAFAAALVGAYVLLQGLRPAAVFVIGAAPAAAALAVYDALAFGSPFHTSYRYISPFYRSHQHHGIFGFSLPSVADLHAVLTGGNGIHVSDGILVTMPVAITAVVGLGLLWQHGGRLEALLCAAVAAVYLVADAGFYAPYGGSSPGPRYFATAIPFLLVGVAPALRRFPRTTLALAGLSVAVTTIDALTWDANDGIHFRHLPDTLWAHAGLGQRGGVVVVGLLAGAAVAVAFAAWLREPEPSGAGHTVHALTSDSTRP